MLSALLLLVAGAPHYELKATVHQKFGIRMFYETDYVYSVVEPDGDREVLWKETVSEKYGHHWISPSGRLWIQTDPFMGKGGGAMLSFRDRDGKRLAHFGGGTSDPARTSAIVLRPDRAEGLELPGNGVLFVMKSNDQWLPFRDDKGTSVLVQTLRNRDWSMPTFTTPFGDGSTATFWSSTKGSDKRYWYQYTAAIFPTGGVKDIERDEVVPAPPAWTTKLGFGKTILLEERNRRPILRFVANASGTELGRIDLLRHGGYSTTEEVLNHLKLDQMAFQGGGWSTLDKIDQYPVDVPAAFDVFDDSGRRWVITLQPRGGVTAEVQTGLAARRPKDLITYAGFKGTTREIHSADGAFTLRIRRSTQGDYRPFYYTFIANVPEGNRIVPVELWATLSAKDEIKNVMITETGRCYLFKMYSGTVNVLNDGATPQFLNIANGLTSK